MTYASLADIRAIDKLDDAGFYPDEVVEMALEQADDLIDRYTGTSFTYKTFAVALDGTNTKSLLLPVIFPRTLTAVTIDGSAVSPTGWVLYEDGRVVRDTGYFSWKAPGRNVSIVGTAGATDVPPREIAWAARVLAANTLIQAEARIPDRALSISSEFGQVQVAQAGGRPDRPTEFPSVNAVLNRHRHRPPAAW